MLIIYLIMPFTFSHPAAILPARYFPAKWVSLTALVIGSITPDFEYFIRMRNLGVYGHTLLGVIFFDLPVAFLLAFIYHRFVKNELLNNLPLFLKKRLNGFIFFNWLDYVKQHFLNVVIGFTIGILTHILWDSFTHRTGYFVNKIPWLLQNTEVFGVGQARFYILQVLSSVIGLLLVIYAILRLPKDETIEKRPITQYWIIVACVALLIIVIRVYIEFNYHFPVEILKETVTINFYKSFFNHARAHDFVMTAISACLISLVIAPFLIQKKLISLSPEV